jgi:hypothetical protein
MGVLLVSRDPALMTRWADRVHDLVAAARVTVARGSAS